MTWVKLDTGIYLHPKVQAISLLSRWLYVSSLCYAARYRTDGWIPNRALSGLVPETKRPLTAVKALVEVGLWEQADGGWKIHDYGHYQRSSEQISFDENDAASRGRAGTRARARLRARPLASAPALDVDVDVDVEKTPPSPPKGGRAADRDRYEQQLASWVARHFPGIPPKAVAHEAALLRERRIEPTAEALTPRIEAMRERLPT